jgi:predicted membrane channel-forming protein YqfA (hemolysin III family)
MKERIKKVLYIPTFGEEVANSVSHGVMTVLMLFALPFSAVWAYLHNPSYPALASAGGIFYTLGAIFYAKKGFRYHHLVWHLLINLAVLCHFVGIVFFLN